MSQRYIFRRRWLRVKRSTVNVTILFNEPTLPPDHPEYEQEACVLHSVAAFEAALREIGHSSRRLGLRHSVRPLIDSVEARPDEVIVNFCEGFAGQPRGESYIAGLLELLGARYTGSTPECLALQRHKLRSKWLLRGAGLPTSEAIAVARGETIPDEPLRDWLARGPLFVKPVAEDASLGIGMESVVTDWPSLQTQATTIADRFGEVLIEPYIDGREFNIAVIALPEPELLPLAEIDFHVGPDLRWPIVTYQAKWDVDGPEDLATQARCPAEVAPELGRAIADVALRAFKALGCRDYARVDMRIDCAERIYILEVNGNPDVGPHTGFSRALEAAGISFSTFVDRLVTTAAARSRDAAQ